MDTVFHIVVAGLLFVAIDSFWLKFVANSVYKKELGGLLAKKPNFTAAAIFYFLYMVGVIIFVVNPALDTGSATKAFGLGALLGLVMYATYDLTNLATLKDWPARLSVIDMAWGTVITSVVSGLTYLIFR